MSIVRFGSVVGLGLAAALAGCGSCPEQPHGELQTRKQNPIPVCTTQPAACEARAGGKAAVRTLDPDQWLSVVIPGYSEERGIGPTDVDCTGNYVFANETPRGGISKSGWPRKIDPDEVEIRSGPEGLRAVWVRVLKFENGDEGGLVALVRAAVTPGTNLKGWLFTIMRNRFYSDLGTQRRTAPYDRR